MTADSVQLEESVVASDDLDLVHASKDGDVAAFEQLVKRYDRKTSPNRSKRHAQHGGFPGRGSGGLFEGLPKLGSIPRGVPILNLADSHHSEPVAYEAAEAARSKRGVPR